MILEDDFLFPWMIGINSNKKSWSFFLQDNKVPWHRKFERKRLEIVRVR